LVQSSVGKARAILKIQHLQNSKNVGYGEIEEFVKNLPGVSKARVNYVTGTIEVAYDPKKLTVDKIKEIIQSLENRDKER